LRREFQKLKIGPKYGRVHAWDNKFPKDRILLEGHEFWLIFENLLSRETRVPIKDLWEEL
jgi:hypothetical protein